MALSEDKRNFIRSPPAGVNFDFEYKTYATLALSVLREDSRLEKMRYELVPKKVEEDIFWKNYFYRVELVKQSFLLSETTQKIEKEEVDDTEKDDSQWEADLEGELNEFQVVTEEQLGNIEVDDEIRKMLEDQNRK